MNDSEWKNLEGQRVQAVLAAVGALPAAALVFGEDASAGAPGAPLFITAIILIAGAYMHWLYTDAIYDLDCTEFQMPDDMRSQFRTWKSKLLPTGTYYQWATYAYGISSLGCTLAGFAGIYSNWRTGISVEAGFASAAGVLLITAIELVTSRRRLDQLHGHCRRMSEDAFERLTSRPRA